MAWHSVSPDGSIAVGANTTSMQENTTYTETTMNKDHFWDIGTDEDGRHNVINMPAQSSDPTTATGMDGSIYLKEVSADNNRIEGFYRNAAGIYQFIPSFKSGTVVIPSLPSSFVTVTDVPSNSYGFIFIFKNDTGQATQLGFFKSADGVAQAFGVDNNGNFGSFVKFGNGSDASGLNIVAKATTGDGVGTYEYRITYWGI